MFEVKTLWQEEHRFCKVHTKILSNQWLCVTCHSLVGAITSHAKK